MSLIVYAVIQAPAWGWASPVTIGVLAAGLAALGALVAAERVTASPMIDVRLFRNLRFTTAAAAVAISFFALLGFIFVITQYFQLVHGYRPLSDRGLNVCALGSLCLVLLRHHLHFLISGCGQGAGGLGWSAARPLAHPWLPPSARARSRPRCWVRRKATGYS